MNFMFALFPFVVITLSVIGFVVHVPITCGHLPIAMAITLLVGFVCLPMRSRAKAAKRFLAFFCVSVVVAAIPIMYTVTDGASCHRPGAFLLAHGWNPIYQAEHAQMMEIVQRFADPSLYLFRDPHTIWMPRGAWIYGAVLYKVFGFVEIADSLNIYLLLFAFRVAVNWLSRFTNFCKYQRALFAMLLVFSPHVIGGLLGGTCDAAVYLLIFSGLFSIEAYRRERKLLDLGTAVLCLPMAACMKFTGLALAIVIPIAYAFLMLRDKMAWGAAAMMLCLVFALNASPFVTSWVNHGGPFYPAHTFDKSEKLPDNMTFDFDLKNEDAKQMGYWGRFAYAYLSMDLTKTYYRHKLDQKTFNPQLMLFADVDGLGAVYRLFFVLSLVGVIFVRDGGFRIMFLVLLASIFMQPGKYMGFGRYVSQVYMIPLVVMLGVLSRKASSSRWVPWALAVLAIGYALPQMPKKLLPYPYMWLISVQNLQVVGAVQNDAKPIVSTANYSAAVSWLCDNKPGVEIIHESERVQDHLSFGPCTGRYHYLAKDPIVDFRDYACVAVTDSNTIVDKSFSAKRHAGIEKYFVKEFLPKELPLIPVRLWQTACYRFRQLFRHWS